MASNQFACRIVQRILESFSGEPRDQVIEELCMRSADLIKDHYGIFVMTKILEVGSEKEKDLITQRIKPHILPMCKHKYGSNFIEKCLIQGGKMSEQYQTLIVTQLKDTEEKGSVVDLVRD